MASTAIPAVKAAIVNTLNGAEELEGVEITADKMPERASEFIWVVNGKSEREFRLIGGAPTPLDEDLTVEIRVVVILGAKTASPSEERATELLEAAETALREDIHLEDTVLWHRISNIAEGEQQVHDEKRGFVYVATLSAKARI